MNENSRRLLPPMGALASFAAAARHDSFSRAGEEIGLSQSAVSRQIAVLEDWIQTTLFDRTGRRVKLSSAGDAYMKAIGPALEGIRAATANALSKQSDLELNIATLPSFGMRWLAPRLPALNSKHPDIIVNFSAKSHPFYFSEERFDAAIHFGLPTWLDASHDLLFHEEAVPVCSPARLAQHPIAAPESVLTWPLLVQSSRRDAWSQWLAVAGVDRPVPAPSGSFEHFLMLAQAAAAGAGLALIPRFLIEPELADGTLVIPFDITLRTEEAYYLVLPINRTLPSRLAQFRAWIVNEANPTFDAGSAAAGP
ncbi:LysR family glycine cleavage system transcriptional activator [Sphingomonas sp. UYAg733]